MYSAKKLHWLQALVLIVANSTLRAAEWSVEPRISLRTGYNDNVRLTAADHDSVWETTLSPSVKFGVAKENQGLLGDAGFSIRRFAGGSGRESGSELNREDYYLNTNAFHNTLRDSFKANLDYTRDSTLDSELDQGIIINDRATRERLSLGPSWSRTLTELTRLELTYEYNNVKYTDDPGIADLVGYDYRVASASLVHQFTPRIQGTFATGYSSYRPDTKFNSDTLSLKAGLSINISETLTASFLAGQRKTTSDSQTFVFPIGNVKTEIETTSAVYTASLTKTLETGSLNASLSRSSSPSGNGELLDATRLVLSGDYNFTERLGSSLKIEYAENETIVNRAGFVSNQEKKTFFRITPRAIWRWHREWALAGEYQYASSDQPNSVEATRNAVYIIITYRPTRMYVSR